MCLGRHDEARDSQPVHRGLRHGPPAGNLVATVVDVIDDRWEGSQSEDAEQQCRKEGGNRDPDELMRCEGDDRAAQDQE